MITLQDIITEADILVPNAYSISEKVPWLNAINQDFFSVVKIPLIANFNTIANTKDYKLSTGVRAKNIDKVIVGMNKYRSLLEEDVQPTQNYWIFNDSTNEITINPAPYMNGSGIVRYHQISTSTFLSTNLTVNPDAPPEYHWTYVPALCAKLALAQDDSTKAANYEGQQMSAWNTAAKEFANKGMNL